MDFEEFARNFRERAAKRMLEFEVALEESRRDIERKEAKNKAPSYEIPKKGKGVHAESHRKAHGRERGPVRGVLKRN